MTHGTIAEWVSHLKSLDVQLSIEGNTLESQCEDAAEKIRLRCNAPEGVLTRELRQELADRKAELISYLCHRQAVNIQPAIQTLEFPLSFAQQRLWFLYQLEPDNPFYNVPTAIRLIGNLDSIALARSFDQILQRHTALRTTFDTRDGQPIQIIQPNAKVDLSIVNLQTVATCDRASISQQLATAEAQRPFNLTTDPLLRVTLLQFDETEAVLLLTLHHIVADGWSLGVLIRELADCYTAWVEVRSPTLPPLPIQYVDFARWQRNWLQGAVLEEQLIYWRKQLEDLPGLDLPTDRPRPAVQTYRGATYPIQLSSTLSQALTTLSQQSGVSLFMTLLAAFQVLLYRYTGQTDMAIGSPIANRHRSELEGLIGFFVNSLVIRSDLSGNPTFQEVLQQVRNVTLAAYEHQDLPFEKLVEELEPERDLSRNPLFQVAFALQNAPMQPLELPGLRLEPTPFASTSTRFDLEVHLWEPAHGLRSLWQFQEGLSGFITYSTDLFDRDRIERLVGHFQTLLEGIVAHPEARLSELPLLTPGEYQQISGENESLQPSANQTNLPELCFHQIFESQVKQTPETMALVTERESFTYQALNQKADRLAKSLKQMGVQADALVGLCVDRSADMVIGILGILKAGAAYVPLDPNYPIDRLHFMLTDTQVSIVLTQSWLVEKLTRSQAQIVCLDQPRLTNPDHCESPPIKPDQLAYIIYTSGSTGIPKGVLLTHRGLCNIVEAQRQTFHLTRNSRILQFSSLSFDASIFEIALAFGSGGTLYIPPQSAQLPSMALVQFLQDNAITHALLTPAVLAVLPVTELPDLQVLITGGEACSSQVVDRWATNRHFFNAYGPTETTIWATVAELHPGDHPQTIGHAISNTQIYILDTDLNFLPVGIPGELYIAGTGLARGYLNRPELTAEQFIHLNLPTSPPQKPNPKSKIQNPKSIRLYKTGDRARYRSDGTIEFLGRIDHQIKIRGFRVELGEIEATLQSHPSIQDAAVITTGESSNEMRLVAYFSLASIANHERLQQPILRSLQTQQIQQWQTLYDATYQSTDPTQNAQSLSPDNPTQNFNGWNSSYTGEPIPLAQMQEWVNDRVQQILALKPQRVLEIGCGTGLLLFQIAPHCQQYLATDFSTVALTSIQNQLDRLDLPQVKLLHRIATDFHEIDPTAFDVVILNSIVQYFPSVDYLLQVLEGAMQKVAAGGVLFIGDVRSLPLLTAFHGWMQFCQADAGMERTQLQQKVERSRFEEPELTIDPAFFEALRDRFPQIRQVQIRLSRGHSSNEMTQFRYNVLLHFEPCSSKQSPRFEAFPKIERENQLDWKVTPITVAAIQQQLAENQSEILLIKNIANSRVHTAVKAANWLRNRESPKTVGRMRELLQNARDLAIDPQDWWDLETVLPYRVEITWSTPTDTGNYDVLLIRHGVEAKIDWSNFQTLRPTCYTYTNDPLQAELARRLIPELRQHLQRTLPDYMVPTAFVPLEMLPLTTNGKVDRRALPPLNENWNHPLNTVDTTLTRTESTLIEIWQELLRCKQISIHDNFFELGGHSLLATQMTSRVRDAFALELPLKSVFEAPTIAQLAPLLESLRHTQTAPTTPPLVRLDRTTHRYKRSALRNSSAPAQTLPSTSDLEIAPNPKPIETVSRSPLVPLTLGGNKPPFFCVHPMFGFVFPYLELAHHLGIDRSFYGLQPLGLDGQSPPLNRIESIAAYYIQAIQIVQPQGPYFLGGWSFGGLVAFEMAQQLIQAGQSIELLAIFDTPAPCHKPSVAQSLKFLLGTALWSIVPFLLDYGTLAAGQLQSSRLTHWQWSAIARLIPEESRLRLLDESAIGPMLRIVYANAQATYRYAPQPYPDRITLFKAMETSEAIGKDLSLGWGTLTKDIQLHRIPGNHLSLLKQPHVQILAQQLRQYLT